MESAFQHTARSGAGLFPGAVAVSCCSVYESEGPDGLHGGSPHVHFTCTEGYVVLEGSGSVQTLRAGGFREARLEPLDVVWFEPGVIHRLVNRGGLRVLVVMQNSGLPEAGDAAFTFPLEVLEDPERYAAAARAGDEDAIRTRRDLAVRGFRELREDTTQLDAFYAAALRLIAPNLDGWEARWRAGAAAAAERTGEIIERLRRGDISPLHEGSVFAGSATESSPVRLGMCGRLAVVDWDSSA